MGRPGNLGCDHNHQIATSEDYVLYIAEDEDGVEIILHECPGTAADVLDCCGDLSGEIIVSALTVREIDRKKMFTVQS
ncbi:hypothetical protein LCGC14_0674160 [marine sediment metagenome]|uniref:Uncharacterized protein n=1 Tax=marine sediment metagenome TaxID=412755 RepID=A0A0F9QV60_9ZZZZ